MMEELVNEIRINSKYTQLTESLYPETLKDKSIPTIRKQFTNTDDYLKKVSGMFNKTTDLLPPNCRYIEKLSRGHLVVVEEPPALRTIKTSLYMGKEIEMLEAEGKIKEWGIDKNYYVDERPTFLNFTLAFPYVIFIKVFDEYNNLTAGQVFLRVARLSGLADYLLIAPLTNISDDQYICYGSRAGQNRSLDTALADSIMLFWASTFNSDYMYNYRTYTVVPYVNSHISWQYHSQTNPMFIYSADWVKYRLNLGGTIEKVKQDLNLVSATNIGYTELSKIFVRPMDTGKREKIGVKKTKYQNLFYDVAQGMYLKDGFFIHVGDPIKLKNGNKAFVDSFIGFSGSDRINYIQFKTENGKELLVKIPHDHLKRSKYLLEAFKKERYAKKGVLANGVEIKEGDIVILDTPKTISGSIYKHVRYIRKTRDGITEAKLGNDFYILENINGNIFNIDEPEYKGTKLKKDTSYVLISSISKVARHRGHLVKFGGLSVDMNGSLLFEFNPTSERRTSPINIKFDPTTGKEMAGTTMYHVFNLHETKSMPAVFRIGRTILSMRDETKSSSACHANLAWATKHGLVTSYDAVVANPNIDQVAAHCLFDNGTKFKIEGFELDIEFNIGDKVVSADWLNPINNLIIKTIQGFKVDKENGTIDFVLTDKNGTLTSTTYVDVRETSNILVGKIRKIVNKFGKLSAGTKIIAEEGFIPNFPKKDVNIIVGFIIDTGGADPFVLCSNGCTLWYSQVISDFKKIGMKAKKWAKLSHAPIDIQKIKFQPGDLIMCRENYKTKCGWLVWSTGQGMLKISNIANIHRYSDFYHLDPYIVSQSYLDCIPSPRIARKIIDEAGVVPAFPNLHGLAIENPYTAFKFINDERSLLHVSDPHK
jgi:hypothetical protein